VKKINLYIHIPFCQQKCCYCHFFSVVPDNQTVISYFAKLHQDLKSYRFVATTIYFGGGTPSLVNPEYLKELLEHIKKNINCEITLEANPQTITLQKLQTYKKIGINRLSFGLQAWQNKILAYLGRQSKLRDFLQAFTNSRKIGFNNINVDLIFGIFGQTMEDWQETIKQIVNLNPEHISCYGLEPNKLVKPGSEILDRQMYHWARRYLAKKGYHHYEISNFAKPGFECRHNLDFWQGKEFLGLGTTAASFINKKNLSKQELRERKLFLNLRLIKGVKIYDHKVQIKYLKKLKLITYKNDLLKLTNKGMDLHNQVCQKLLG